MDFFEYRDAELHCEDLPAGRLAGEFGTPVYIYSRATILHHLARIREAFAEVEPLVCYSVKANGNLGVLKVLAGAGAGFDVVSGGELFRVLRAGGDAGKAVFAGVGKTDPEIDYALREGIKLFTVESLPELENISGLAGRLGRTAGVAIRVKPGIAAETHAHLLTGSAEAKFGMEPEAVEGLLRDPGRFPGVVFDGLHAHIGSQITEVEPYARAAELLAWLLKKLRSEAAPLSHVDLGGGFGINYAGDEARPAGDFAAAVVPVVRESGASLILEPGRFIVGNAGALLARVLYVKEGASRRFVIVDAGMNDLIRPALYGAHHEVWPAEAAGPPPGRGGGDGAASLPKCDVVGPICESADVLARDVPLPPIKRGDLLAVFSAGAYGFAMSSNYNSRPRAAEVLVDRSRAECVRRRESYEDLVRGEEP